MAIFTVQVPDDAHDAMSRAERTVLLREGFSLRAFVFGLLYLLYHRLWLATLVWVGLLALLGILAATLHLPVFCLVALAGLMHLFLGLEGRELRRRGLQRRGYALHAVLSASDLGDAETLFFAGHPVTAELPPSRALPPGWMARDDGPAVIGLFPDGRIS